MKLVKMQAKNLSYSSIMNFKSLAREQHVQAVYYADSNALELAASHLKSALKSRSASIARPRRLSVVI